MNTYDYKLFEVNNSSSEAFQFYRRSEGQLDSVAQSATDYLITTDINAYCQLNSLKVESMLGIGQPNVKRLLTKLSKQGILKARLYKCILDLISKNMLMLRYSMSITRYSRAYFFEYVNCLEDFLSKFQTGYEGIINTACYKLDSSASSSHIVIIDVIGIGKMGFLADLDGNTSNSMQAIPHNVELQPAMHYSIIERGILNDFGDDVHLRFKQLAIDRKSEYDKSSFSRNDYICYDDYVGEFYKRLEDTILYKNSSRSLSLYNLYMKRVGISEPEQSMQYLCVSTDAELACIRIKTNGRKKADELLCYLHHRLRECPWYIWSETNDLEASCLIICCRSGLNKKSNERYKFEAEILSKVSMIVVDFMNCLVENLFPNVISVENYYVLAYGPMQINYNFNPYSSFPRACRLNKNVLKAINMLWLLDEGRSTMCYDNVAVKEKASSDKALTLSEIIGLENEVVDNDTGHNGFAKNQLSPSDYVISLSEILGANNEDVDDDNSLNCLSKDQSSPCDYVISLSEILDVNNEDVVDDNDLNCLAIEQTFPYDNEIFLSEILDAKKEKSEENDYHDEGILDKSNENSVVQSWKVINILFEEKNRKTKQYIDALFVISRLPPSIFKSHIIRFTISDRLIHQIVMIMKWYYYCSGNSPPGI